VSTKPPVRILVVDDDLFGLQVLKKSLASIGYRVETADSAAKAIAFMDAESISSFDCVISDHHMPGMSGIELLDWIMAKDNTLSTIIITAEEEKEIIQHSLRSGAVDFIQKPVKQSELVRSIAKAIENTHNKRRLAETQMGVKEASRMNQIFQAIHAPEYEKQLKSFMMPTHDVGGDFMNIFSMGDGKVLFVVGDVSGHDVRAAFVSAYFQGLVRGLFEMEKKSVVDDILPFFNRILSEEWNNAIASDFGMPTSLGVYVLIVDFKARNLMLTSCGLPTPAVVTNDGNILFIHECGHPLGWFADDTFALKTYDIDNWGSLFSCSDGLEDFAKAEHINPFTLTYHLISDKKTEIEKKVLLENATDDVFTMRFQLNTEAQAADLPQPVFYARYTETSLPQIDDIHHNIEMNLHFLFENNQYRLFDFLTCCREALINAIKYGCKGRKDTFCEIKVTFIESEKRVRVRIDDPGEGHHFDPLTEINFYEESEHFSLGLAMMKNLCDDFRQERKGATVIFDFVLE